MSLKIASHPVPTCRHSDEGSYIAYAICTFTMLECELQEASVTLAACYRAQENLHRDTKEKCTDVTLFSENVMLLKHRQAELIVCAGGYRLIMMGLNAGCDSTPAI